MKSRIQETLSAAFKVHTVVSIAMLREVLPGRSLQSFYRDLDNFNYVSSCSHRGMFYAFQNVLRYDSNGLWRFNEIIFSKYGTLKETIRHFVESSEAGLSCYELNDILRLKHTNVIHNTLLDLADSNLLGRITFERGYVYISVDPTRAAEQEARRNEREKVSNINSTVDLVLQLQVLRAHIKDPTLSVSELARNLKQESKIAIGVKLVEEIFLVNGISLVPAKKKE